MVTRETYWSGRRIFITGANGFVGSWLVDALLGYEADITVLQKEVIKNSIFEQKKFAAKCNIISGVLEDFELMQKIVKEDKPEIVFHLAAQTQVKTAYSDPFGTFEANVRGTYNLLEAVRRFGKETKVIVASSDKAYGSHDRLPYTEDFALKGDWPYDVSKSCVDLISQSYYKTYGTRVTISRCGNFIGPGDLNFDRIVPDAITSILKKKQFVIRSDGQYTRDYIHVKDAADSYLTLGQKMDELKIDGEAFNFTNEQQLSVLELYNKIETLMKYSVPPKIANTAKAEIRHQHLSGAKAKKVLGWTSKYSIESALEEAIEWYTELMKKEKVN